VSKKILIADDEAHILHVLSLKLQNAGYDIITAVDGEEAYDLCLVERPDLVITDFQMPFMSGLDFLKRLRQHEEMRGIPAMMLTARDFDISPPDRREAGIGVIFAKPFAPREVLSKVRELLGETQPIGVK
jgi:two-component system alkaline phosphatase synthesis response regulator PhoP